MDLAAPQRHQPRHSKYDAIHRALLTGLLSNVGAKGEAYEYLGPRSVKFSIFPGSALFTTKPKWLVAGELVETTKLYARTCAGVQPQWIERAAAHLVERTYSEPRWDAKSNSAIATERVTLYGLVLVPARVVPYGPINARIARELFIHHGLVLEEAKTEGAFAKHNAALVREVESMEAKIRQKNLLAGQEVRYAFYDARVPTDVIDGATFERWRRDAEKRDPRLLFMKKEDLLRADAPPITPENYPEKLEDAGGGIRMPVVYRYEPGEPVDGLTVTVPVAALGQLRPQRYEWLVPGMLEEKIAALLRGLSGALRRNFVPVPEWSKAAAEALRPQWQSAQDQHSAHAPDISLRESLAAWLARQTGVEIRPEDFDERELPIYLRMNFKVVDDSGKTLGISRELPALQKKFARESAGSFATVHEPGWNRESLLHWEVGDLPDDVTVHRFGMCIVAHPALVDTQTAVALRLLPSPQAAAEAHRAGVRRLFQLEYRRDVKGLTGRLPDFGRMKLQYLLLGRSEELKRDLITLIVDRALFSDTLPPRRRIEWDSLKFKAATRLYQTAEDVATVVSAILEEHLKLALIMEQSRTALGAAASDVHDQLVFLLIPHFLTTTPYEWLAYFPRYIAAMRTRLEKLLAGGTAILDRDDAGMAKIAPWWNRYLERKSQHDAIAIHDPELELVRWMIEEWRVALFAQELGTALQVSDRRLEKQWEKVRR